MQLTNAADLKFCGRDVRLYPLAKIVNPNVVCIGDGSQIDDFSFINGGRGVVIGKRVHVASFVSVVGGGEFHINDYAGLACGVRIVTGSERLDGSSLVSSGMPKEFHNPLVGKIWIGKHVAIFSNAVVLPNITIAEGAVVGAGSVVNHDLEPWTIYAGHNCRKVGRRDAAAVQALEAAMIAKYGY
jgi:acetyltransferase-like isoleucine patch superfamily enzyme